MSSQYDDILHLPHPTSSKHPRMSIADRAAQFSPFAALNGHEAAIQETARLTDGKIELTEERKYELDLKLQRLVQLLPQRPEVSLCCFVPDQHKQGGAYITISGYLKKIDTLERTLYLTNGTLVPIDDISEIDSPHFKYDFK